MLQTTIIEKVVYEKSQYIYPPMNIINNNNLFTEQDSNTILHF